MTHLDLRLCVNIHSNGIKCYKTLKESGATLSVEYFAMYKAFTPFLLGEQHNPTDIYMEASPTMSNGMTFQGGYLELHPNVNFMGSRTFQGNNIVFPILLVCDDTQFAETFGMSPVLSSLHSQMHKQNSNSVLTFSSMLGCRSNDLIIAV